MFGAFRISNGVKVELIIKTTFYYELFIRRGNSNFKPAE